MAAEGDLAGLVTRIRVDASGLDRGLSEARSKTKSAASDMQRAFGALRNELAQLFGAAYIRSVVDYADHLSDLSKQSGVAVESLSELAYAAKLSGTSIDVLAQSLKIAGRNISDAANGSGTAVQTLKDLHLNAKQLSGLKLDDQLLVIAEAMQQVGKDSDFMAVGMDIFGRSFAEIAPLVREGASGIRALREEARQLGLTISTASAEQFAQLNDQLDTRKMRTDALARTILENLVPAFTDIVTGLEQILNKAPNTSKFFNTLGLGMVGIASKIGLVDPDVANAAADIAAENIQQGQAATTAAQAARRQFKNIDTSFTRTNPQTLKALDDVKKKQEDINKTIADHIVKLNEQSAVVGAAKEQQEGLAAYYDLVNQLMSKGLTLQEAEIKIGPERKKHIEEIANATAKLKDEQQEAIRFQQELKDKLSESLSSIAFSFKSAADAVTQFASALAKTILEKKITGPLSDSIMNAIDTSGLGKSISSFLGFGGVRANGGPVSGGKSYVVGEQGPEIFTPRVSGAISPNAGGGVTISNAYHFASGVTRAEVASLLPVMEKRTMQAVFSAMQQGGSASRLIGQRA